MTPEGEVSSRREIVAANTDIVRMDDHPLWPRFRELLGERGADPYATALPDSERALVGDSE